MLARRDHGAPNKWAITVSIMLATIMVSLDTTIANVALPHIQGSVSASQDQITWVLTSYIVASTIMTPMTGWLSGRIGRKQVFLISIAGFTIASMLCGAAGSLFQIVLFRLRQPFIQRCAGRKIVKRRRLTGDIGFDNQRPGLPKLF